LIGMAQMLMTEFGGQIPLTVEDLVQLPGVGRKTANVITSVVDNQPNMAVDTHVFRVSARIGLTVNAKTPLATEKQLLEFIPREMVHIAHHWLILHGRYICVARTPKCEECGLQQACKWFAKHGWTQSGRPKANISDYGAPAARPIVEKLPVVKTRGRAPAQDAHPVEEKLPVVKTHGRGRAGAKGASKTAAKSKAAKKTVKNGKK
jgi:adenine-specific DNA glycosylase